MSYLGDKAKKAAQAGGQGTAWTSPKAMKGSGLGKCPGCLKDYEKMGSGTFARHQKADFDCPDV